MKGIREILTATANIGEMILQSRVSPTNVQLQRLQSLKCEAEIVQTHQSPSDDLLYFLIDKEYYQIRNKFITLHKNQTHANLLLTISFTITDKNVGITETVEVWRIKVNKVKDVEISGNQSIGQLIHLLRNILRQLTSQSNLSALIRNKEASKRNIIDFKITVEGANKK